MGRHLGYFIFGDSAGLQGCNYRALPGKVQVFGKFINHPSPVQLGIDTWNDGGLEE